MNRKTSPLVSVAMATCNGEEFLEEQIRSILSQSYSNIELVVCDDASTDGTMEILEAFRKKNDRVKVYQNDNRLGVVRNFEKAIGLCEGEYVALSDQDDIWLDNKIEELLDNIGGNLLIHSDAILIDGNGKTIADSYTEFSWKVVEPETLADAILNGFATGCTLMFCKELKELILPFPEDIYMHDKWICLVAFLYGKACYWDKRLTKYRQHDGNALGAELIEDVNFAGKLSKINKNRKYYKNHPSFKKEMRAQLAFAKTIAMELGERINQRDKADLRLIIAYFENAASNGFKLKSFLIRLRLFTPFDKGRPLKLKLFNLFKLLFM